MEVVLDANVLFRTLISSGEIVQLFFDNNLKIIAPEVLKEEFLRNKEEILAKSKLSEDDLKELLSLLFPRINFAPLEEYQQFLPEAKRLLGEHFKDEDFVALALLKKAKIWTYEKRLFKIGLGISTKEIAGTISG